MVCVVVKEPSLMMVTSSSEGVQVGSLGASVMPTTGNSTITVPGSFDAVGGI